MKQTKALGGMVLPLIAGIYFAASGAPLFAHHSFASEFDANRPVKLAGTVTSVEWTNPHAHFFIDVKGPGGKTARWELELGSPNALRREGWSQRSLKPGDYVTVRGYEARDGSSLANALEVRMADGRRVFAGSSGGR